jgi:hypothetical protein
MRRMKKSRASMKPDWALLATCFQTDFLLGLFFSLEDGGNMFF